MDKFTQSVCCVIDAAAEELNMLSQSIWSHPELNYEEVHAHQCLTDFLTEKGFLVQRSYHLETAFRASYGTGEEVPNVALLCEYDALPLIGHACGHNLIAEIGVAAGLAVKAVMAEYKLPGKVTIIGCPAEEGGGGKIRLINAGAFKDVDVTLMAHPCDITLSRPILPGIVSMKVWYYGKPSHACTAPWQGVNALDAAVTAYQTMSVLRQQIKPTWRLSSVISYGGEDSSIIPERTELKLSYRAASVSEIEQLGKKIESCLNGAAISTGCKVEIERQEDSYAPMLHNDILLQLYESHAEKLGLQFTQDVDAVNRVIFSTDMGDVSQVVPSIHPVYTIPTAGSNHTHEFKTATGESSSQKPTLTQAKILAMTALQLFTEPDKLLKAKQELTSRQHATIS